MKKVFKWIGILFVAFIVLTIIIGSKGSQDKAKQENTKAYEILSQEELSNVENYNLLVKNSSEAKSSAEVVKKSCKKACNIAVYDDKKAYDLEMEYKKLTDQKEIDAWKKTNYIFVADHLVGSIDFETGTYKEYPYRDWYYKELKGE